MQDECKVLVGLTKPPMYSFFSRSCPLFCQTWLESWTGCCTIYCFSVCDVSLFSI